MARSLNGPGSRNASARIAAGDVSNNAWSFSASDGDKLLGANGDNWTEYSRWFLGRNSDQGADTKAGYSYPLGKGGNVYLAALRAIASRASAQGDDTISSRASSLLETAQKAAPARRKQMMGPTGGEDQLAFMSRCMNDETMNSAFPEAEDRAAICCMQWDEGEDQGGDSAGNGMGNGASVKPPFAKQMPMPAPNESRPQYMARCHADAGAMDEHPGDAARAAACGMMWDAHGGDQVAHDSPQMTGNSAVAPNSKKAPDGRRHSVALLS